MRAATVVLPELDQVPMWAADVHYPSFSYPSELASDQRICVQMTIVSVFHDRDRVCFLAESGLIFGQANRILGDMLLRVCMTGEHSGEIPSVCPVPARHSPRFVI